MSLTAAHQGVSEKTCLYLVHKQAQSRFGVQMALCSSVNKTAAYVVPSSAMHLVTSSSGDQI